MRMTCQYHTHWSVRTGRTVCKVCRSDAVLITHGPRTEHDTTRDRAPRAEQGQQSGDGTRTEPGLNQDTEPRLNQD